MAKALSGFPMLHTRERIASNAVLMISAMTLQKVIALLYFALIARWFGAAVTGEFAFATSVGMIFTVLFDCGQTPLIIKSSAADTNDAAGDFSALLGTKLLSGLFIGGAALVLIRFFLVGNDLLRTFLTLIVFSSFFETLQMSFYGVLRSKQWVILEAVAGVVGQFIILVIAFCISRGWLPLGMLVGAVLVVNGFHLVLAASTAIRRFAVSVHPTFIRARLQAWIARAVPFAIAQVFVKLGTYTDTVLLRVLAGAAVLGVYSVSYKLLFSFQFIPLALISSLFPAMSYFASQDRDRLRSSFHWSMELLLFLGAPIAFGTAATAPTLIPLIFGSAFHGAVPLTQVAALAVIPLFLQYPTGSVLNASERAATQTRLLGAAMVVNVTLNLVLIPMLGPWGAVIALCASHSLVVIGGAWKIREVIAIDWKRLRSSAGRILASALAMYVLVLGIRMLWKQPFGMPYPQAMLLLVEVVSGAVVYLLLTHRLGIWRRKDLTAFASSYGKSVSADHS